MSLAKTLLHLVQKDFYRGKVILYILPGKTIEVVSKNWLHLEFKELKPKTLVLSTLE